MAGFIREEAAFGGGISEGRGLVAGIRWRRTSRSSRSESRSEMLPSAGSLSRSLSLTSSMRAWDIVFVVGWRRGCGGGVLGGVAISGEAMES